MLTISTVMGVGLRSPPHFIHPFSPLIGFFILFSPELWCSCILQLSWGGGQVDGVVFIQNAMFRRVAAVQNNFSLVFTYSVSTPFPKQI